MTDRPDSKPGILFVDDDERLLDGLRRALRRHRDEWEMRFVGSGREALAVLEDHAVDIVISDMRMPEMDGAELLARVRERQPDAIRFVLSGQSGRDAARRAAQLTHQFLPKPIEVPVLERVLARALSLRALFGDPALRGRIDQAAFIPGVPRPYVELTRRMASGSFTLADLTRMAESDPALADSVLHVANSALFGLPGTTFSIDKATAYLGPVVVRSLVLATGLYREVERLPGSAGIDLDAERSHGLAVALLARVVAGTRTGLDAAFMAGLLHDFGKPILGGDLPEHPAVAAYLLRAWGLPQQVVEAVAYHHAPLSAPYPALDAIAAVHIADALVREREAALGRIEPADRAPMDAAYVAEIGVEDRLAEWRRSAAGLVVRSDPGVAPAGEPGQPS